MDLAFLLEISFYLLMCVMTTLYYEHLTYFIEILQYVAIVEMFKKYFLPNFERTQQFDGNLSLSERTVRKPENDSIPTVHSTMIFKMCQSLGIKTRLAPEEKRCVWIAKCKKSSKPMPTTPVVKSKIIYEMCNALDIKVILSPTIDQDTVTLEPNKKPKQNKPPPLVRSVMVYSMCRALGLETELIFE
ncbi:hypothetical protein TNCT_492791 [Trichonephila clavata]|uniref:Uncharacterized protein n=1 Tax=Trichonephila clavata TaxID=2740835 RepID=A0A8X6JZ32_TRICU|nr:hypothetical protein TNCT_492791 [Trichonephila clavata]